MLAVKFSSVVREASTSILRKLHANGGAFNGLHLRMEDDISDAVQDEGGFTAMVLMYERAFQKLGFCKSIPIYIASGIFGDESIGRTSELMAQVRMIRTS